MTATEFSAKVPGVVRTFLRKLNYNNYDTYSVTVGGEHMDTYTIKSIYTFDAGYWEFDHFSGQEDWVSCDSSSFHTHVVQVVSRSLPVKILSY